MGEKKVFLLEARSIVGLATLNVQYKPTDRQGVDYVLMVDEDCTVKCGDVTKEAEAGDIVVKFYEEQYPNKFIVVKNEDWKQNILAYREYDQKRKEQWAVKEKACTGDCIACDVCKACSPTCNAA